MASTSESSSSSPSPPPADQTKHDVFLSFRGKDTGMNFTAHLLAAFTRNCIYAFFHDHDDDDAEEGEGEISETHLAKISESLVSVVVFSENYGGSSGCLDELVKIMEWKEEDDEKRVVLPVFLGVEPTHVRKRTGAFGDGFNVLIQDPNFKHKADSWRRAFVQASNLSGWDSKEKSQDKIVEEIVKRVDNILEQNSLDDRYEGFVGVSRIEKVESLLCIGSSERVHCLGIWGMGGIGKTTIAKHVFCRLYNRFEASCFVPNVKRKVEREGLDSVQKDMLLQLLAAIGPIIGPYMFTPMVQMRMQRKKLLIVLDDVENSQQLKALLGRDNFYGPRSRIIVTSRDKQVLKNVCTEIYEVEKLNHWEAFVLFKLHAFKQDQPTSELMELSVQASMYAHGVPLALEVLGCNLYNRNMEEWEMELGKLEKIPNIEITDILRSSYDGLDEKEKSIFLDIACIFESCEKDVVETIMDGCGFYGGIGLSCLSDKALINIGCGKLWMHDLLMQMGRDIVSQGGTEEPGKRSRLWDWKDIYDVLTENMGTENVEVISLDMTKITDMDLGSTTFMRMLKLRVLIFERRWNMDYRKIDNRIHLPQGLDSLPDELRYLHWDQYPLASLPREFHPRHLVRLNMLESRVRELWSAGNEPDLPYLKTMDLRSSKKLIKLPDLSKIPNLESLDLCGCSSLEEVPSSIEDLSKLQNFRLIGCISLKTLPKLPSNLTDLTLNRSGIEELSISSISGLTSLEKLYLNDCKKLKSLPESLGNLQSLYYLSMVNSGINSLPNSISNLISLEYLFLEHCPNLTALPENLGKLKSLQYIITGGCPVESLPASICDLANSLCLESLTNLDMDGSSLETLPTTIKHLPQLQFLHLNNCLRLQSLPELPKSLEFLEAMNCASLKAIHSLPGGNEKRRFNFNFRNCDNVDESTGIKCTNDTWMVTEAMVTSRFQSSQKAPIDVVLYVPGRKVPKWFEYSAHGNALQVRLSGGRLLDLGDIAFCVVLAPNTLKAKYFSAKCKCGLLLETGEHFVRYCRYPRLTVSGCSQSEHVFMWFTDFELLGFLPMRFSEATFEFEASAESESQNPDGQVQSDYEIVECGITPIRKMQEIGELQLGGLGINYPEEEEKYCGVKEIEEELLMS